jgi:hypothetical protein
MGNEYIGCHKGLEFGGSYAQWRKPETEIRADGYLGKTFRTCSYCGSIHPEDLIAYLEAGATLHGADWKYGWPHKFYVQNIPNPLAGQRVKVGSRSWMEDGERKEEAMYGDAPKFQHGKWYNEHLLDLDEATYIKLRELILKHADIEFNRENGGLRYTAPHQNYQK